MTPDERQLISGLFDRMRANGPADKDREADSLINQAVRQTPDAGYLLVQSVLAQEHYLQQASSRIEELEERMRHLEDELDRQQQPAQRAPAGGGSFLGGLFGGGRPAEAQPQARQGSVPSFGGGRQQASAAPAGTPWGRQQPQGGQAGTFGQQRGAFGQPPTQQQPAAAAGGGFMRSALTTAAGVAGGMMAANALQGMLGGSSANAATPAAGSEGSPFAANPDQQAQLNAQQDAEQDAEMANEQHASYDDGGADWGSSDDSEY